MKSRQKKFLFMKKKLLAIAALFCIVLFTSCTPQNEPEKETGFLTIENLCSYYATANVFLIEGDIETEIMEFDIPAKGSITQTLEVGSYRVFARCRSSLNFIDEKVTITKGSTISVSITK